MSDIPIDARQPITREKYLNEDTRERLLNAWFIFGEHANGWVDISDVCGDVVTYVPKDKAERILAARDKFLDVICSELCG